VGDFAGAAGVLQQARGEGLTGADLSYLSGRLAADSCSHFDPNGVIEHLERAVEINPRLADARRALGAAYEMKEMYDWAVTRAQEHLAEDPDALEAIGEMGRARTGRGEYGDAIDAADQIVRQGGDVYRFDLGAAFTLGGFFDQLGAMYDPEMERTNDRLTNASTHLQAGINDVWMGRLDQAVAHFERGAEYLTAPWERPRRALLLMLAGRGLSLTGRFREADGAFASAIEAAGLQAPLLYARGVNALMAGDTPRARKISAEIDTEARTGLPGWGAPWKHLIEGEILLAEGSPARSREEMRQAWRLEQPLAVDCVTGHTGAYFLSALGRAYMAAGQSEEAQDAFEQVRSLGYRAYRQPELAIMALRRSAEALQAGGETGRAAPLRQQYGRLWGTRMITDALEPVASR
jgi:tetratricopeptide (TPR) repeat protein